MGTISVQNITKEYDGRTILDDVSVELYSNETVGLVGANGSGKTTLFRMIAGQVEPEIGTITSSKGMEFSYLAQEPEVDPNKTLAEEVAGVFDSLLKLEERVHEISHKIAELPPGPEVDRLMAEYDRVNARFIAGGGHTFEQDLEEVIGGLGFSHEDRKLPMSALSGGQKCRAALAKALLEKDRFLLLDEPTNHLDIDAVRWLERFLAGHHRGAVIVSHDRYLLDRVAEKIIEIDRGKITTYPGNYSNYVQAKQTRLLSMERQYEKDRDFIEKEQAFIDKHMAGQRTKEAQGRRTRLERRIKAGEFVMERPTARKRIRLNFDRSLPKDRTILEVEGLSKTYGHKTLFQDMRFEVASGQRFGITGPNGTGKTTLLKIVMEQVKPDSGEFKLDSKAIVGYYTQEATDLHPERSVLDEIRADRDDMSELEARSFLGAFHFSGDDVFKPVGLLSGGEQSRVRVIKLILSAPNVLILDEPTNHLDIPSREALEEALDDFPGTIIAVSHDRYFLDRISNRLLMIRPDHHRVYNGNYSYYLEQTEQQKAALTPQKPDPTNAPTKKNGSKRPTTNKQPDADSGADPRIDTSKYDTLTIDDIQALIIDREEKIEALTARLADHAIHADRDAVASVQSQIEEQRQDLQILEAAWENRIENL